MGTFNPQAITGDFGGAVADLFAADALRSQSTADLAKANAARVAGQADRLKSQGDIVEGQAYGEAAGLADLNAKYTEASTRIQTAQADRALFGTLGGIKADIAGSGFGEVGSGGDILRDSAAQGALNRAVLTQQGQITEAGFEEQASSFRSLQTVAGLASQEDLLAAQGEDIAAQSYTQAAAADKTAAQGKDISAIISGIAGVAQIALAIPTGGASLGVGGMGLPEGAATGGLY
jgi:hypothetical protein